MKTSINIKSKNRKAGLFRNQKTEGSCIKSFNTRNNNHTSNMLNESILSFIKLFMIKQTDIIILAYTIAK